MVWYGMVWYGMVWYVLWNGMEWYGMVWYSMVWYGIVWYGMVHGTVYGDGMVWHGNSFWRMVKNEVHTHSQHTQHTYGTQHTHTGLPSFCGSAQGRRYESETYMCMCMCMCMCMYMCMCVCCVWELGIYIMCMWGAHHLVFRMYIYVRDDMLPVMWMRWYVFASLYYR